MIGWLCNKHPMHPARIARNYRGVSDRSAQGKYQFSALACPDYQVLSARPRPDGSGDRRTSHLGGAIPRRGGYPRAMSEVTRVLSAIEQGDPHAAEQLLPLVYEELRKLAAQKLAEEKPGQTLQATGLVHEAYLRLVGAQSAQHWNSRGHFFAASAEAMRRILVEQARRKLSLRRGGGLQRRPIEDREIE